MRDFCPDVIGVTEVKPKISMYLPLPSEYNLNNVSNFNMFTRNVDGRIGRGMILYVRGDLEADEVKMNTEFEENIIIICTY